MTSFLKSYRGRQLSFLVSDSTNHTGLILGFWRNITGIMNIWRTHFEFWEQNLAKKYRTPVKRHLRHIWDQLCLKILRHIYPKNLLLIINSDLTGNLTSYLASCVTQQRTVLLCLSLSCSTCTQYVLAEVLNQVYSHTNEILPWINIPQRTSLNKQTNSFNKCKLEHPSSIKIYAKSIEIQR